MSVDPLEQLALRLTALRPPSISPAAIEELARAEFTGTDPSGTVSATVTGAGELTMLEVPTRALRGEERASAGVRIVAAVNIALDQLDTARRELLPSGDVGAKLREITEAFGTRMDGLLGRLDEISRTLPRD